MNTEDTDDNSSDDVECPTCGRDDFANENGMKTHHVQAHGESIAGREVVCSWCDSQITIETYRAKNFEHNFCGDECMGQWRSENKSGENAARYKGKVTVECVECGDTKEVYPSRAKKHDKHYCSGECQGKHLSDNYSGEDSWHWKGGRYPYYGDNWSEQRLKTITRDQARCQDCGMTERENYDRFGRVMTVHHLNPRRNFVDEDGSFDQEAANEIENLITLCDKCHHRWEKFAPLRPA